MEAKRLLRSQPGLGASWRWTGVRGPGALHESLPGEPDAAAFCPRLEGGRLHAKGGHDAVEPTEDEKIDAEEFVARVLVQIPDSRRHLVRYYGAYSNRARGQRRKAEAQLGAHASSETSQEPVPPPPERAALRRRWADLIRRVYEVDPLVCRRCGGEMRVVSFITEPGQIRRILDHLRKRERVARTPPPRVHQPVASTT